MDRHSLLIGFGSLLGWQLLKARKIQKILKMRFVRDSLGANDCLGCEISDLVCAAPHRYPLDTHDDVIAFDAGLVSGWYANRSQNEKL